MIPGRASVVRDRYGARFIVAVPEGRRAAVRAIPGTSHDHTVDRYEVPVAREGELRRALAGLDVSWSTDHRAVRRCAVCREPLAQVLIDAGDRVHIGCRLPDVQQDDVPQQEVLL